MTGSVNDLRIQIALNRVQALYIHEEQITTSLLLVLQHILAASLDALYSNISLLKITRLQQLVSSEISRRIASVCYTHLNLLQSQ